MRIVFLDKISFNVKVIESCGHSFCLGCHLTEFHWVALGGNKSFDMIFAFNPNDNGWVAYGNKTYHLSVFRHFVVSSIVDIDSAFHAQKVPERSRDPYCRRRKKGRNCSLRSHFTRWLLVYQNWYTPVSWLIGPRVLAVEGKLIHGSSIFQSKGTEATP